MTLVLGTWNLRDSEANPQRRRKEAGNDCVLLAVPFLSPSLSFPHL